MSAIDFQSCMREASDSFLRNFGKTLRRGLNSSGGSKIPVRVSAESHGALQ